MMMTGGRSVLFRVGLALEGVGWHPAAWPESSMTDPAELFGSRHWTDWGRAAATGGIDFVTLEDGLSAQTEQFTGVPGDPRKVVRGRLDPVVTAAILLSSTDIGEVVVSRNVTHSNPFHVATQLASLAAIAPGRVTFRPQVSANAGDATVVGGTPTPRLEPEDVRAPVRIAHRLRDLFRDAESQVRAIRSLWSTFPHESLGSGDEFWRYGPIAPRVPDHHPAAGPLNVPVAVPPRVAALAHHALEPYRLAAAVADRVFLTPTAEHPVPELVAAFRQIEELTPDATKTELYADIAVVLGDTGDGARARLAHLNHVTGAVWSTDTGIFTGTAPGLAEVVTGWRDQDGIAGVRLRPAVLDEDGQRIIRDLVPLLAAP
ncbi:hypothetical protein B1H26_18295 [Amycolatopsis sp. BJA-103]|nr:hypothetical protein B1H26_18295 [Amycolatopsis sp. BJA-103]